MSRVNLAVAAVAWLAELFPVRRQRELALAYTQSCYPLGGLMVSGACYLAVTYGERLPAIHSGHEAWRYTLLSGLIPAIPLMVVRPFLPESPVWRDRKSKGMLKRPSIRELFRPHMRKATLLATLMMACTFAIPYGGVQHTPRIVPGIVERHHLSPKQMQQTVSTVYLIQELGSIVFVKENLTFTGEDSAMSNLLLSVMGAFAHRERANPRAPA